MALSIFGVMLQDTLTVIVIWKLVDRICGSMKCVT